MPLFSIIIPVYDSERFLAEAVQSVLEQNFPDLEVVLVNDCSTDKSGSICDSFGRQHEFIKVIHHEKNLGVAAARNTALKSARGDYILFLDSDDCLFHDCLHGLANLIEERPDLDLIVGKYTSQKYSLRGDESLPQDFTFDNSALCMDDPNGVIAHIKDFDCLAGVCWRYVIRHRFIIQNQLYFIPARINEDEAYVVRLLCLAVKFAFYDKCLYWYRARIGSITESITHEVNFDNSASFLKVTGELCKLIKDNNFPALKKQFLYARIKNALITFYGFLPMHNRKEIYEFSQMIDSNGDYFKMLEAISDENPLYMFVKVHGSYYGLLLLKALAIEKTVSLIEGVQNRRLYIFCADLFGKTTAQILTNEGYSVECFLDNNKGLEGKIILGLQVHTPSILSLMSKKELSAIFVIVCHQCEDVFESMVSQLEQIGLRREQIAHQLF